MNMLTSTSYKKQIGFKEKLYLCFFCETPTKFIFHYILYRHTVRFHFFYQKNKGMKRGDDDLDGISQKKSKR